LAEEKLAELEDVSQFMVGLLQEKISRRDEVRVKSARPCPPINHRYGSVLNIKGSVLKLREVY